MKIAKKKSSRKKIEQLEQIPTRKLLKSVHLDLLNKLEKFGFDGPSASILEKSEQQRRKRS